MKFIIESNQATKVSARRIKWSAYFYSTKRQECFIRWHERFLSNQFFNQNINLIKISGLITCINFYVVIICNFYSFKCTFVGIKNKKEKLFNKHLINKNVLPEERRAVYIIKDYFGWILILLYYYHVLHI